MPICATRSNTRSPVECRRTVAGVLLDEIPSCGAIYFNGPALENFDLAVANKLARAGVSDGEAVKFIRKAVGLPAVTLAELLDTSPETVSRWERGVSRIDRAAFAILAGIVMEKADDRSDTLERLRALRHPARLGQLVQIEA